jgi:hypothetical protein
MPAVEGGVDGFAKRRRRALKGPREPQNCYDSPHYAPLVSPARLCYNDGSEAGCRLSGMSDGRAANG